MKLYYNNKFIIITTHNLIQHDIIRHIEVDKFDNNMMYTICFFFLKDKFQLYSKEFNNNKFKRIIYKLGWKIFIFQEEVC